MGECIDGDMMAGSGEEKIIAISDIHGYLDEAEDVLDTVSGFEGEGIQLDTFIDTSGEYWSWEGGEEYTLVFNGDLFDRGESSEEVLRNVFTLQDDAPDGHVVYNIGNHEVFALFPDVFADLYAEYAVESREAMEDDRTYYWWWMEDELREELLERTADGRVTAAY
ncbi:MAG: metallophosphoesterase, partial [Candidatus Nanohaloarchaea archaeon]|nr:metallophosphoesterase [Candidatus Nanohaloarchaea archaeon]